VYVSLHLKASLLFKVTYIYDTFFYSVRLFRRFCVVIRFFLIPATTANDPRYRRIFYPRFYPLHLFSYLNAYDTKKCIVHNNNLSQSMNHTVLLVLA